MTFEPTTVVIFVQNQMLNNTVRPIPIPFESAYFLTDGKKTNDDVNTYSFPYPKEWLTADKGEMIIGVRTVYMIKIRRKLEYRIKIRKYVKEDYNKLVKLYPDWSYEQIYESIDDSNKASIEFDCVSWIPVEDDLREIYVDLIDQAKSVFDDYNKAHPDGIHFIADNPANIYDRDVQMDEYYNYDVNCFGETMFSPRNDRDDDPFYVDIALDFKTEYDDNHKLIRTDFLDVMNIGHDKFENEPEQYKQYSRIHNFNHVWDRHSCKIFASFATDVIRNYIGNSQQTFTPIKYYKVNSTSDRFTISFCSARHPYFPVKIPHKENMVLELQFMQYNKLLYI